MSSANQGPFKHGQDLRRLLDSGDLERLERELIDKLRQQPQDLSLLQNLGELYRRLGRLQASSLVYEALKKARPHDNHVATMMALLGQGHLPFTSRIPAKFLRMTQVFEELQVQQFLYHVRARRPNFKAVGVLNRAGETNAESPLRRSAYCDDVAIIKPIFEELLLDQFENLLRRLDLQPFEPITLSCKWNVYHHGDFFKIHQDLTGGMAETRKLAFIYYFAFPPKRFQGGELVLYDRDPDFLGPMPSFTSILPEHNSLIIFPATVLHEVLPVVCESADWFAGRFTFTGWIHDRQLIDIQVD